MLISMYMGSSSSSQKKKNWIRSSERKTPATAVSRISSQAKYSFWRRSMRQETSTDASESRPVSSTIGAERPSTPRKYCTENPASPARIHSKRSMNWKPSASGSRAMKIAMPSTKLIAVKKSAIQRASLARCRGNVAMVSAPTAGSSRKTDST